MWRGVRNWPLVPDCKSLLSKLQEPLRAVEGFIGRLRDRCREKLDDCAKQYMHFAVQGTQRMTSGNSSRSSSASRNSPGNLDKYD